MGLENARSPDNKTKVVLAPSLFGQYLQIVGAGRNRIANCIYEAMKNPDSSAEQSRKAASIRKAFNSCVIELQRSGLRISFLTDPSLPVCTEAAVQAILLNMGYKIENEPNDDADGIDLRVRNPTTGKCSMVQVCMIPCQQFGADSIVISPLTSKIIEENASVIPWHKIPKLRTLTQRAANEHASAALIMANERAFCGNAFPTSCFVDKVRSSFFL